MLYWQEFCYIYFIIIIFFLNMVHATLQLSVSPIYLDFQTTYFHYNSYFSPSHLALLFFNFKFPLACFRNWLQQPKKLVFETKLTLSLFFSIANPKHWSVRGLKFQQWSQQYSHALINSQHGKQESDVLQYMIFIDRFDMLGPFKYIIIDFLRNIYT